MEKFDINERKLKNGDVVDLHQTVNGQNLFVVFTIGMAQAFAEQWGGIF